MSTRGNYIFTTIPKVEVDGEWLTDVDAIKNLTVEISNDDEIVKNGYKVYVHSDNYPSYALPNLFDFLNSGGAKARSNDPSYLSAWFVAYHATNNLLKYNVEKPENQSFDEWKEFIRNYESKGDDILNTHDFTGIGLENNLSDWADYTYLIIPGSNDTFRIFIYGYKFNYITDVYTAENLKELEKESWWD